MVHTCLCMIIGETQLWNIPVHSVQKNNKKTGKYLKQSHVLYTARLFMCAVCVRWVDKGWLTQHSHWVWIGAPSELKDGRKKNHCCHKRHSKEEWRKGKEAIGREGWEGEGLKETQAGSSVRVVTSVWLFVSWCIVPVADGDSLSWLVIDN